jgi:hypothetical protein
MVLDFIRHPHNVFGLCSVLLLCLFLIIFGFHIVELAKAKDMEIKPLVVVHVDSVWEGAEIVAIGVNMLSKEFNTVYLLVDHENWRKTTLVDFEPTQVVIAPGGDWEGVKTHVAVMVGGYLRTCFKNAARAMVQQNREVLLVLRMEYIYHNSKETLYGYYQSEWKNDRQGFLDYMQVCAKEFGFQNPLVTMKSRTIRMEEK